MKNVIISETDRIGDVILTLPVFKTIKKFDKNIKITALVKAYTSEIFENFKFIDDIIIFNPVVKKNRHRFSNLLFQIKANKFDTAIVLHPNYTIGKLFKQANIPIRITYGWKWYQFLFSKILIQHRSKNNKHQAEYNLELLKLLNINKFYTNIQLKPKHESLKFINSLLTDRKLSGKKFIIIHPGSGNSALNLPIYKYIELIKLIEKKFRGLEILITAGPNDKNIINYFIKNNESNIHIMPQNLSLTALIALISLSTVFISNSTGPMHIASALKIPVIAFFSPVFVHSYKRWGPYWGNNLIVQPEINCPEKWKCKKEKCKFYNCFNTINFEKVLAYIKDKL